MTDPPNPWYIADRLLKQAGRRKEDFNAILARYGNERMERVLEALLQSPPNPLSVLAIGDSPAQFINARNIDDLMGQTQRSQTMENSEVILAKGKETKGTYVYEEELGEGGKPPVLKTHIPKRVPGSNPPATIKVAIEEARPRQEAMRFVDQAIPEGEEIPVTPA